MLVNIVSDLLCQPIIFCQFFAVNFFLPVVESEKEIKDHAGEGNKNGGEQVGKGFAGGMGFRNNSQANKDQHKGIKNLVDKNPVHIQ